MWPLSLMEGGGGGMWGKALMAGQLRKVRFFQLPKPNYKIQMIFLCPFLHSYSIAFL